MKPLISPTLLKILSKNLNLDDSPGKAKYNDNVNSVGIIGCGWLGTVLAHALQALGTDVFTTTRTPEKQAQLINAGIPCEIMNLALDNKTPGLTDPNALNYLIEANVFKQQHLIICITPQFKQGKKNYAQNIQRIVEAANINALSGHLQNVILVSSTGVYKNLTGDITEERTLDLLDEKVSSLINAENKLQLFSGTKAIIRFGGLVGPKRHPGRFLAGKTNLGNASEKVNLIHQVDAVGILLTLLYKPCVSGVFNAISNTNITRQQFYEQATSSLGLVKPKFQVPLTTQENKNIKNNYLINSLGYELVYPDLSSSFEHY